MDITKDQVTPIESEEADFWVRLGETIFSSDGMIFSMFYL